MSETKDPLRVQPHLKKCFEGIAQLTFNSDTIITAMESAEDEKVGFCQTINPAETHGLVEKWLVQVSSGLSWSEILYKYFKCCSFMMAMAILIVTNFTVGSLTQEFSFKIILICLFFFVVQFYDSYMLVTCIHKGTFFIPHRMLSPFVCQVERVMKLSLREVTAKAVKAYTEQTRTDWVLHWPGQVVLAASTIHWTAEVSDC